MARRLASKGVIRQPVVHSAATKAKKKKNGNEGYRIVELGVYMCTRIAFIFARFEA